MKIFSKLFKMFLFVIIAPLFITAVFLFQYQRHAKKELLQNYLNIAGISAVSLQNNALNLTENILANLKNKTVKEQAEILTNQIKTNKDILFLALFSQEGKELTQAKNEIFENFDILSIIDFTTLNENKTNKEKIKFLENIFPPYTTIIAQTEDGKTLFLIADFATLIAQTERHKLGKSGGIYFVDEEGYSLLNKGDLPLLNLSSLDLSAGKGSFAGFKAGTNLIFAGAYIKNPLNEGYLFLLQSQREAFYTINLISWLIIFFVLATTTLSYFASLYFAEDLAEPIDKLIDAAHEITKNNFSVSIDDKKYLEEFSPLIKTFNAMAEKLKEYQAVQLDKLIDERNKTNLLARLMRDGIIMCTLDGKELFANKVAKYILNSEAFARNLEATIRAEDLLEPSLKELLKVPSGTIFHYTKENRQIYFEVVNEVFRPQNEEPVAIILFRDITSEHEIREMKNDVFNAVAHDLRAPILGIQGYIILLEEGNLPPEQQNKMLKAISSSSKMLVNLVENILDISKIERGLLVLNKTTFDLGKTLNKIITTLLPLAKQKNLTIETNFNEPLPLYADQNLIERVFSNLLSNAIKFTSKGGVNITAKQEGKNYKITVQDTGIGIAKDELAQIFTKYHQADRNINGYGLGLTIVKQITEAHKGQIEVSSIVNKGTTFTLTLPLNLQEEDK